jgi:hypothetical protein
MEVDSDAIYFMDEVAIRVVRLSTGAVETLVAYEDIVDAGASPGPGMPAVRQIRLTPEYLVWIGGSGLWKLRK